MVKLECYRPWIPIYYFFKLTNDQLITPLRRPALERLNTRLAAFPAGRNRANETFEAHLDGWKPDAQLRLGSNTFSCLRAMRIRF